jgi:phosphoribosylformimino-5-aminoimidazole carboxamide ribotide isomerase
VIDLLPAIDLRAGRCVRLYQGDFDQETVYGDDPVAQARRFADEGATWIHVVDLDAARTGDPVNRAVVAAIAEAVDVPVQSGGGVRSLEAARALADAGVARVVIGTAALRQPELVAEVSQVVAVAVGLDVRGREVAVAGWEQGSGIDVGQALPTFSGVGAAAAVVTQIDVDGTGQGPDLDAYRELLAVSELPLVASGGVGTLEHLRQLDRLEVAGRRVSGVIVGRALYDGAFTLGEARRAVC